MFRLLHGNHGKPPDHRKNSLAGRRDVPPTPGGKSQPWNSRDQRTDQGDRQVMSSFPASDCCCRSRQRSIELPSQEGGRRYRYGRKPKKISAVEINKKSRSFESVWIDGDSYDTWAKRFVLIVQNAEATNSALHDRFVLWFRSFRGRLDLPVLN
jgi:hypothetical protein